MSDTKIMLGQIWSRTKNDGAFKIKILAWTKEKTLWCKVVFRDKNGNGVRYINSWLIVDHCFAKETYDLRKHYQLVD